MWRPLIAFVEPCSARQWRYTPRARIAQSARENKYSSHGLPSCSTRCKLVLHILLTPPGSSRWPDTPAASSSAGHGSCETVNFFMIGYAGRRHSDPTILCWARHRVGRLGRPANQFVSTSEPSSISPELGSRWMSPIAEIGRSRSG